VRSDERGYASLLVIGFTLIALGVAGIAIDGTRAFLLRRSLQNAADAAALAGASEIDRDRYYLSSGAEVTLDPERARARAGEWLSLRALDAEARIEADEASIRIDLLGDTDTTFLRAIGIRSIPVGVRSVARPLAAEVAAVP
jgi:hypothetical protein